MAADQHYKNLLDQLEKMKQHAQADIHTKKSDSNFTNANDLTLDEETELKHGADPSTPLQKYIEYAEALDNIKTRKRNGKILKWKIKNKKQDVKMRRKYASKAYGFVFMWSCFLFLIVFAVGYGDLQLQFKDFKWNSHFKINDTVLIALISGVTVNIVAVFVIVIRNLFPVSKSDLDEMEKLAKKSEGDPPQSKVKEEKSPEEK